MSLVIEFTLGMITVLILFALFNGLKRFIKYISNWYNSCDDATTEILHHDNQLNSDDRVNDEHVNVVGPGHTWSDPNEFSGNHYHSG